MDDGIGMDPGKDNIFINYERYCNEFNVAYNTCTEAVTDLIKAGLITPTLIKRVYWINPLFLFTGNRIKKYPDSVKIVNKSEA